MKLVVELAFPRNGQTKPDLLVNGKVSDPKSPLHGGYLIQYLLKQKVAIVQQISMLEAANRFVDEDIEKLRVDAEFAETYLDKIEQNDGGVNV